MGRGVQKQWWVQFNPVTCEPTINWFVCMDAGVNRQGCESPGRAGRAEGWWAKEIQGKETCKACSLGDMVLNKPQPLSHLTLCTSQASSWDSEQRSSNQQVEQVWVCLLPGQPLHQKRQRCPLSPIDMGHWSSRVQMWQSRTGEWQNRGQVSWKLLESGWKVIFLPLRFY